MFTTCRKLHLFIFLRACKHLKKDSGLYLNIPAEPLPSCYADSKRAGWSRLKRRPPLLSPPTNKHSGERSEPALCERLLVPLLSCLCSRFSSDGVSIVVFLPSDKNAPFQQILSSCPSSPAPLFRSRCLPHVSGPGLSAFLSGLLPGSSPSSPSPCPLHACFACTGLTPGCLQEAKTCRSSVCTRDVRRHRVCLLVLSHQHVLHPLWTESRGSRRCSPRSGSSEFLPSIHWFGPYARRSCRIHQQPLTAVSLPSGGV